MIYKFYISLLIHRPPRLNASYDEAEFSGIVTAVPRPIRVLMITNLIKNHSDRTLLVGLIFVSVLLCSCWYLLWFQAVYAELAVAQNTQMLNERARALEKKVLNASRNGAELCQMKDYLVNKDLPLSLPSACAALLSSIEKSGVLLVRCKPGMQKEYSWGVVQMIQCEMRGTFAQVNRLLMDPSVICRDCYVTKQSFGLLVQVTFYVSARTVRP